MGELSLFSPPPLRLAVVMPTRGHFDYVAACIESFIQARAGIDRLYLFVIDDASPDWDAGVKSRWRMEGVHFRIHRFTAAGGLTRSINLGMTMALVSGSDFIAVVNSDILVPPDWHLPLVAASKNQILDFSGPLTNAPGRTNTEQDVRAWHPDYILTDLATGIANTAESLRDNYAGRVALMPINGFFMFGSTQAWQKVRHSPELVFPARIDPMPSGKPNPTPLMTGQEDWLASRCRALKMTMGVALDCFVFHYRSVSRGDRYRTAGSMRRAEVRTC